MDFVPFGGTFTGYALEGRMTSYSREEMEDGMEHTYPQTTVEVWPVTDGHGTIRLFANEKAAELYAAEHDGAAGAAMPVRTARTVWRRVCVKFDADSYEVADCSDPYETRPVTSLASRLTGPTLAHIGEDGSLAPGAPKWMELPGRMA